MSAIAMFKGLRAWGTGRPRRRAVSRVAVMGWAVASIALLGAGTSALLERPSAKAMVVAFSATAPVTTEAQQDALVDPTHYRKSAPPVDGRPRIAVIVRGLAVSAALTARAIKDLPPDITLALSPYGRDLQKTADAAHDAGHEIFLDLPVEPSGYPANDAGPEALLTAMTPAENLERLNWNMARFSGYAGIAFPAASPALDSAATISPVLSAPVATGIVWAHPGAKGFEGARIEGVRIALAVDETPKAEAIGAALERLEAKARSGGSALAIAAPYPVTLDVLTRWAASLDERGFVLVPASALAVAPAS